MRLALQHKYPTPGPHSVAKEAIRSLHYISRAVPILLLTTLDKMRLFPTFVFSTLTFSSIVNCVLSSVSRQVSLGADSYFLPPTKSWSIGSWDVNSIRADDEFLPLTVVQCNDSKVDEQTLKTTFDTYLAHDDVWTPEFANGEGKPFPDLIYSC